MNKTLKAILLAALLCVVMLVGILPICSGAYLNQIGNNTFGNTTSVFRVYNEETNKFSETMLLKLNSAPSEYYFRVYYRVNGGAWLSYDEDISRTSSRPLVVASRKINPSVEKVEYHLSLYRVVNNRRIYLAQSPIRTYTFDWTKPVKPTSALYKFMYYDVTISWPNGKVTTHNTNYL